MNGVSNGGPGRFLRQIRIGWAVVLLAGACALSFGSAALGQASPAGTASPVQSVEQWETLALQYVGAAEGANSLAQQAFKSLSQSSDRTLPQTLWNGIGLSGHLATYADIYAAVYRSQMLPALTEIKIELARLKGAPGLDPAKIDDVISFDARLAMALHGLDGETISQPSFVSRLNALFAQGEPLLGARISLVVEPNDGSVSPAPQASSSAPPGNVDVAGYIVSLLGTGAEGPIHATLLAPAVRCTRTTPSPALLAGISLGGPIAGSASPQVMLTVTCSDGHAVYSSDPVLAPGEQIRSGDRLNMTIVAGASRSTVSLNDASRNFEVSAPASGIAVRTVELGVQPLSKLSVSVSPGKTTGMPSVGATTLGPVSDAPLPSFAPITFQSCSIAGKPLASFNPGATDLTTASGRTEVTTSPLNATRFSLSLAR